MIGNAWQTFYDGLHQKMYDFTAVRPKPSDWAEANIIMPKGTTNTGGKFEYLHSPYMRPIIDILHPSDPTRDIAIMKPSQCGATTGLIVPGMLYIMSQNPAPILFTSADVDIAAKTMEERFEPVMYASGLKDLIRPVVVKKGSSSTGDKKREKQFSGGSLTALGTNNPDKFRFYSVETIFCDEYDTAPKNVGKEGHIKNLLKGRQTIYPNSSKTFYICTPTIAQTSNVYEEYLNGTQEKWHWCCPHCEEYIPTDFEYEDKRGGLKWDLDQHNDFIEGTQRYECPNCFESIQEIEKFKLNKTAKYISTVEKPVLKHHRSFYISPIVSTFTNWKEIIRKCMEARPADRAEPIAILEKGFMNQTLGLPYKEKGANPESKGIMKNLRDYEIGQIPETLIKQDENGSCKLLTLCMDLNGIMDEKTEDVRVDYEVVAHTDTNVTYSVDHGSIGTFKRSRHKSKSDKAKDSKRNRWTLRRNVPYSVWDKVEELITKDWVSDDGEVRKIGVTLVDWGFGAQYVNQFVTEMQRRGVYVYGVKGFTDSKDYTSEKEAPKIKDSRSNPGKYFNVEVNHYKDLLAENMLAKTTSSGYQESGFMNFPTPSSNKYTYNSFFFQFETEVRIEKKSKDGISEGFNWEKKNADVQNHFWDTRVYNLAARDVFLYLVSKGYKTSKLLTWERYVDWINNELNKN